MPVVMSDEDIARIKAAIPALKSARIKKYAEEYGLSAYDSSQLTSDVAIADLFDGAVALGSNPKKTANFIMGDVMRLGKEAGSEDITVAVTPAQLAATLRLIDDGAISLAAVQKDLFPKVWGTEADPAKLIDELGLRQSSDSGEIEAIVREIMDKNEKVVNDYRSGNEKVVSFFVGQVMKATKGKANPKIVNETLLKLLKG